MNKANNHRAKETNRAIIQAVFELMIEGQKPLSRITIQDVCERAGIHRSTFYAHYQDIYDVVERVEKTMSVRLAESFLEQLEAGAHADACFENLFAFIAEHREFYRLYLNETHKAGVIGVATELFRDRLKKIDYTRLGYANEDEQEYHMTFYLHGITALIRRWIDRDCRESPHELYEIMKRQSVSQQWMMEW